VLRECESKQWTNIFGDLSEIKENALAIIAAFKEAEISSKTSVEKVTLQTAIRNSTAV